MDELLYVSGYAVMCVIDENRNVSFLCCFFGDSVGNCLHMAKFAFICHNYLFSKNMRQVSEFCMADQL